MSIQPTQRVLEEYHASLQSYIFEGQIFWNRISAFVLINSALLVARGALPSGPVDRLTKAGISVLGIAAVALWAHTAVRAHYLNEFWLALLRDLETRLELDGAAPYLTRTRYLAGDRIELPRDGPLHLPWLARVNVNDSTSGVLTVVFAAVWIVALVRLL